MLELPGAVLRPLGRVIGRSWKSSGAIKIDLAKQRSSRRTQEGLKRKKHLFGTCFRRILAILGRLKRPWEATKAPKKPLEGILG